LGLAVDGLLYTVGATATMLVVGVSSGTETLGHLRAAQGMLGPILMVVTGLNFYLVPRFARTGSTGADPIGWSLWAGAGALLLVGALSIGSGRLSLLLYGKSTAQASVVLLVGIQMAATVASAPLVSVAKAKGMIKVILGSRIVFVLAGLPLLYPRFRWSASAVAGIMAIQAGGQFLLLVGAAGRRALSALEVDAVSIDRVRESST
jgi:O-antigen/teichoic acid export membrane protein